MEMALRICGLARNKVQVLFYIQGLKQREIADLLHISLPLVKYRLGKAKAQLQQILSEEGT